MLERGRGDVTPISKMAVKEFCATNDIKIAELAEISGYSTRQAFERAVKRGYIKAYAMSNLLQYFDLPRGYFEGAHSATGDAVVLAERDVIDTDEVSDMDKKVITGVCVPPMPETPQALYLSIGDPEIERMAKALQTAYGYVSVSDMCIAAIRRWYEDYERTVAERYKSLSKDELIRALVNRDLGVSDV